MNKLTVGKPDMAGFIIINSIFRIIKELLLILQISGAIVSVPDSFQRVIGDHKTTDLPDKEPPHG